MFSSRTSNKVTRCISVFLCTARFGFFHIAKHAKTHPTHINTYTRTICFSFLGLQTMSCAKSNSSCEKSVCICVYGPFLPCSRGQKYQTAHLHMYTLFAEFVCTPTFLMPFLPSQKSYEKGVCIWVFVCTARFGLLTFPKMSKGALHTYTNTVLPPSQEFWQCLGHLEGLKPWFMQTCI